MQKEINLTVSERKKKKINKFLIVLGVIAGIWTVMTLFVQFSSKSYLREYVAVNSKASALIVFNPDPIYNLDEAVCNSFAQGLSEAGITTTIASVKTVKELELDFELFVFCVNTYNWAPDWRVTKFIKEEPRIKNSDAVAITVGAGSTMRAQRKLEWHLKDQGVNLLGSEMFWLLRPNDESRMKDENTRVAQENAHQFGKRIGTMALTNNP